MAQEVSLPAAQEVHRSAEALEAHSRAVHLDLAHSVSEAAEVMAPTGDSVSVVQAATGLVQPPLVAAVSEPRGRHRVRLLTEAHSELAHELPQVATEKAPVVRVVWPVGY